MPAVEPGSYAIDSSSLLALSGGGLASVAVWALGSGSILVTSPSVVVATVSGRLVQTVLGIGSLVSPEEPPVGGYVRISRKAWVDGCRVAGEPSYILLHEVPGGRRLRLGGVVEALDSRDPAALFVNGLRVGDTTLTVPEDPRGLAPLARLGGYPVLSLLGGRYAVHASRGPLRSLLEYIVSLASACR